MGVKKQGVNGEDNLLFYLHPVKFYLPSNASANKSRTPETGAPLSPHKICFEFIMSSSIFRLTSISVAYLNEILTIKSQ
jgi:hypothetical protein